MISNVDYTTIDTILSTLETQFSSAVTLSDPTLSILYSKLAVLELSGWIEESIDLILFNYLDNKLISADCINKTKKIIENNYGFKYESNLYHIFLCALGSNNWENIIDTIGDAHMNLLSTKCGEYTLQRNDAAHKYQLVTRSFYAPSRVISDYHQLKLVITELESEVLRLI